MSTEENTHSCSICTPVICEYIQEKPSDEELLVVVNQMIKTMERQLDGDCCSQPKTEERKREEERIISRVMDAEEERRFNHYFSEGGSDEYSIEEITSWMTCAGLREEWDDMEERRNNESDYDSDYC